MHCPTMVPNRNNVNSDIILQYHDGSPSFSSTSLIIPSQSKYLFFPLSSLFFFFYLYPMTLFVGSSYTQQHYIITIIQCITTYFN